MNNYLMIIAVPLFVCSMTAEYLIARAQKVPLYQLNDFVNNLSCGILEQVAMLPFQGLLIFSYHYCYTHYALFSIDPHSIFSWLSLWIGVDFIYYWFHRACHRNNFLWIGHSVHHQSEQYNLSVALRQGIGQTLTGWVFYLPLAYIGFPTWMFLFISTVNVLYQFWIHTKLIKNMGWFEKIFNSPSHHRVHHGKNTQYIDKNYAGSLIIWDKLFGTFEKEDEPVEYGVTEPLRSWNPFYANIKVIGDTLRYAPGLPTFFKRVQSFFMPPEWILTQLINLPNTLQKSLHLDHHKQSFPIGYVLLNLMLIILTYSYLLVRFDSSTPVIWCLSLFLMYSLLLLGGMLNKGKLNNFTSKEAFRSVLLGYCIFLFLENSLFASVFSILFFLLNYFLSYKMTFSLKSTQDKRLLVK